MVQLATQAVCSLVRSTGLHDVAAGRIRSEADQIFEPQEGRRICHTVMHALSITHACCFGHCIHCNTLDDTPWAVTLATWRLEFVHMAIP